MDVTVKRFLVDRTKHLAPDGCGQDVDIFDSCPTSLQLHHLSSSNRSCGCKLSDSEAIGSQLVSRSSRRGSIVGRGSCRKTIVPPRPAKRHASRGGKAFFQSNVLSLLKALDLKCYCGPISTGHRTRSLPYGLTMWIAGGEISVGKNERVELRCGRRSSSHRAASRDDLTPTR